MNKNQQHALERVREKTDDEDGICRGRYHPYISPDGVHERDLKWLEQHGLIQAEALPQSPRNMDGPLAYIYTITQEGRECLESKYSERH